MKSKKDTKVYPRILFLDIEVAPNIATVWDIWNQNIGINQLQETSYVLCWSAKWKDNKEVMFDSVQKSGKQGVIKSIWKLIDEADIIIHYNGKRFDIPTLNKEFLLYKMRPPRPYQQIDLYQTVKTKFRFVSNKLAYITKQLGLKGKIKTDHQLWLDCMSGDKKAWKKMEMYNRRDVTELQDVYNIILPWITNHPNIGMFTDKADLACTNCGSTHLQSNGYRVAKSHRYKRYQCQDCGTWLRELVSDKKALPKKPKLLTQIGY
jgi:DNA polymerase elongation subunit (family B)